MNRFLFYFFILCSSLTLFNCSDPASEKNKLIFKSSPTDPFKDNLPQSEFFDISAKEDNVVEGKNGTLIVIPKGCFKNGKGETVENVKVELAEALSQDDMILSNLTTTSNGEMLETGGMVYINATSNGEQVFIDKANPLYIEIPTENKKAGMMAYKGIRDEKGNMNWIDPKPLENYLVPVDFSLLNFYPEGFEAEVQNGMPFRKYKVATKELTDSLYYSLSVPQTNLPANVSTDYNEPYYNLNKEIKDGKYTKDSYITAQVPPAPLADSASACSDCRIDPAIIKTIKTKKFQNTFLATKEFEARLKVIFKTCRNDILEIYINNHDKNLWEADEMAYKASGNDSLSDEFKKFAEQKLTNVKGADKYASILKAYYEKKLKQVKEQLENTKNKYLKQLENKNKEVEKVANEYRKVLWKREKYRMETYGFEWSDNGWINVDKGIVPKDWETNTLEYLVKDGKSFDQLYTYVVYTSIQSIYRLNTSDNENFYVGNQAEKSMIIPKRKPALALAIGYKGEKPFIALESFETITTKKVSLTLRETTLADIKRILKVVNNGYRKENQIDVDLKYQEYFYKEKKRQEVIRKEEEFIQKLRLKAFPCKRSGEELFMDYCSSCHSPYSDKKVGPGLGETTSKHYKQWIINFTKNSSKLIASGDKEAVQLYNEYGKTPCHLLT